MDQILNKFSQKTNETELQSQNYIYIDDESEVRLPPYVSETKITEESIDNSYNRIEETYYSKDSKIVSESGSDMESVESENGRRYVYEKISDCPDLYKGNYKAKTKVIKPTERQEFDQEKQMNFIDVHLDEERKLYEMNKVEGELLFNRSNKSKLNSRLKEIPESHFDLHLNKKFFKTDLIDMKNHEYDVLEKERRFWAKKGFIFIQAAGEHRMQFWFSICGLLSVLSSKVATKTHVKLFSAIIEEFSMHNPWLPLERALQNIHTDKKVYTRGDNEISIQKANKRRYNQNYKKKRQDNNERKRNDKKVSAENKNQPIIPNNVEDYDSPTSSDSDDIDYNIDDYNHDKLMEEIDTQIELNLIGNFEGVNEQLQNNPNNQDGQDKQVDEVQLMNQGKELKDLMDN